MVHCIGVTRLVVIMAFLFSGLISCSGDGEAPSPSPSPSPTPSPTPVIDLGFSQRPNNQSCLAGDAPVQPVELLQLYPDLILDQPLDMVQAPGEENERFFIAEKDGRILSVNPVNSDTDGDPVLAIQLDVFTTGEAGIASIAFHPSYQENRLVYVSYVAEGTTAPLELRLSEFTVDEDATTFSSERIVMRIPAQNNIHFAGALAFGADSYLYFSVGDNGDNSPEDTSPLRAQDPSNVYGSILRIDVNTPSATELYSIPSSNPDLTGEGPNEVWAYGFRNPWRMSFDREGSNELLSTNVGASSREELNLITVGGNYGWPSCEGSCEPSNENLIDPLYAYRNLGGNAAIGGFVYRGTLIPELQGKYLFGDFGAQEIFVLDRNLASDDPFFVQSLLNTQFTFADFAEDNRGELYLVGFSNGAIYQLIANSEDGGPELAEKLSDIGCFSTTTGGDPVPVEGLIEYDVAHRFWSDGASKRRYLAIPNNTTINVGDADSWVLPPGGVTIKSFYMNDTIFETRVLLRYTDGTYGSYTYEWDDDLHDATLVSREGKTENVDGIAWRYPSRGECFRCHSERTNVSLSLESRQLNISRLYPLSGVTANQIDTFAQAGILSSSSPAKLEPYVSVEDLLVESIEIEDRVFSYLHVNCVGCHDGSSSTGRAAWDASFDSAFSEKGLCRIQPFEIVNEAANADEQLVFPGDHELSTLWLRSNLRDDPKMMPPLASSLVDTVGNQLIAQWINALDTACPPIGTVIPARILASNYDRYFDTSLGNSGDIINCGNGDDVDLFLANDSSGECQVGWTTTDEWLEYDIHAASTGSFDLSLSLATGAPVEYSPRHVRVELNRETLIESVEVQAEGWLSYSDYTYSGIEIPEGNHRIRIYFIDGAVNLRDFRFSQ